MYLSMYYNKYNVNILLKQKKNTNIYQFCQKS
jgi:hypothetical protein